MKPLSVLVLVLVAVGVLFFAISNLPSKKDSGSGVDLGPGAGAAVVDPPSNPDTPLPGAGSGVRDTVDPKVPVIRVPAASGDGWANQLVGSIEDPEGKSVAGAQVVLTRSSPEASFFVNAETDRSADRKLRTGSDGRFSFENVQPYDHYAIEVYHEDFSRAEVVPVRVGMEGVFEEGPIVLQQGATLKGMVRAQDGGGIAGATLYLDSMFFQAGNEPNPDRLSTTSDNFGNYEFTNVAAGHRSLLVNADGFAHALINGLNFRQQDVVERDVTLDVAEMICGRVVDSANLPVAGAEVQALSFSNSGQQCREITQTEADGAFCLSSIAPGKYLVAVRAEGYSPANQRSVSAGDTNVLLQMTAQATVSGTVLDGTTGEPVTRFRCGLRQTFSGVNDTTPTSIEGDFEDSKGAFVLSNVPPGNYLVEASAPGYAPSFSEQFQITQAQPVGGIIVRLGKGGQITGVVLDPSGAPIARARINTKPNDWTGSEFDLALGNMLPSNVTQTEAYTNSEGEFTLEALRPEKYQLRVVGAGLCEVIMTDVVVPDGATKDLGTIQMMEGGTISGKVYDQAGRAVGNARISLRIDGRQGAGLPRFYNTKANAEGDYEIKGVFPGNYQIQAQPPRNTGGDFLDVLTGGSASRPVSAVDGRVVTVELKLGS